MPNYQSILADTRKREEAARKANIAREKEIRSIYGQEITQYEEGGAFKEAGLADIERAKTQAVGAGTQQMISSGLYGTTTAASIPVQAETQAQQSRLRLEDILQQRVTEAKGKLAGFVERIEDPYPDYNMLVQAMIGKGQEKELKHQRSLINPDWLALQAGKKRGAGGSVGYGRLRR